MELQTEFVFPPEASLVVERAKRPVPIWKRASGAAGGFTLIAFAVFMSTVANALYPFSPAQKPPREGELVFCLSRNVEMPDPFEGNSPYKAWTFWFPRWSIEADSE